MSELDEKEITDARMKMMQSRIENLEDENKKYLEVIRNWEIKCKELEKQIDELCISEELDK